MKEILYFLSSYIFLITLWGIINGILFSISYIIRKNISFVTFFLIKIVDFLLQLYIIGYVLYSLWQLLIWRQWLLLLLAIIFGGWSISIYQFIFTGLLLAPFHAIADYFIIKAQNSIQNPREEYEGELISPEGKTIGKIQSTDKANSQLAIWFLLSFVILFFHQFTTHSKLVGLGLGWFIITPMTVMITAILFCSIIFGSWNLIRHKYFFSSDKKSFFTKCLKAITIVYGFSLVTNLLLS